MKLQSIQVPEPCHESWSEMTPVEKGRFCSSCQKCVTDFTTMNNNEIADFLKQNTQNVCGRIGVKQLEHFNQSLQSPSFSKWHKWKLAAATLTGLTLAIPSMGQTAEKESLFPDSKIEWSGYFHAPQKAEKADSTKVEEKRGEQKEQEVRITDGIVRGYVFDEESKEPLIGVTIYQKGTTNGTVTDIDGYFELNAFESNSVDDTTVLVLSYVGFETQELKITPKNYTENETTVHLKILAYETLGIIVGGFSKRPSFFTRTWRGIKNIFRKKH